MLHPLQARTAEAGPTHVQWLNLERPRQSRRQGRVPERVWLPARCMRQVLPFRNNAAAGAVARVP